MRSVKLEVVCAESLLVLFALLALDLWFSLDGWTGRQRTTNQAPLHHQAWRAVLLSLSHAKKRCGARRPVAVHQPITGPLHSGQKI